MGEGAATKRGKRIRKVDGGEFRAALEATAFHHCEGVGKRDFDQAGAKREGAVPDSPDPGGNGQGGECPTKTKAIVRDLVQASAKLNRGEAGAFLKYGTSGRRYGIRETEAGETHAVLESTVADAFDSLGKRNRLKCRTV